MRRKLGLRIGLVIVVIAVSLWYLYPPRSSINLGLDLQGGIHLVLGVDVDKALEAQVERAGDTVRGELEKKGIAVTKIERRGISDLAIQIASPQSWDSALPTATEVRRASTGRRPIRPRPASV
jgi:preprotein translocase subunit SecD